MTELDKMARELLAAEYDRTATVGHAQMLRSTMPITTSVDKRAVNAIRAALLTAPPGYVLVPTDPGNLQLMWMGGHDEDSQRRAYAGLIAAAPEPEA